VLSVVQASNRIKNFFMNFVRVGYGQGKHEGPMVNIRVSVEGMYVCIFVYWQTWHVKTHPFIKRHPYRRWYAAVDAYFA